MLSPKLRSILNKLVIFLPLPLLIFAFTVYRHSRDLHPTQVVLSENTLGVLPINTPSFSLIPNRVVRSAVRSDRVVALTFDADPSSTDSSQEVQILNYLETEKIPATLFLSGLWAERFPDLVKRIALNQLFEIGNHSYSHPGFTSRCRDLIRVKVGERDQEFSLSQRTLFSLAGYSPKLFRFPGGCSTPADVTLANQYSLTVIGWDVDSRDWQEKDPQKVLEHVKKEVKNGSIILLHFHNLKDKTTTEAALPLVVNYLKDSGFQFLKVSDLLSSP